MLRRTVYRRLCVLISYKCMSVQPRSSYACDNVVIDVLDEADEGEKGVVSRARLPREGKVYFCKSGPKCGIRIDHQCITANM